MGNLFGQRADGAAPILQILPLLLVFVVFYLVLLRPEQQRRREHERMVAALKRGDRVVASGIHGRVTAVAEKVVNVEIARNVQVEVDRSAIQTVEKAVALEVREKEREKS